MYAYEKMESENPFAYYKIERMYSLRLKERVGKKNEKEAKWAATTLNGTFNCFQFVQLALHSPKFTGKIKFCVIRKMFYFLNCIKS